MALVVSDILAWSCLRVIGLCFGPGCCSISPHRRSKSFVYSNFCNLGGIGRGLERCENCLVCLFSLDEAGRPGPSSSGCGAWWLSKVGRSGW